MAVFFVVLVLLGHIVGQSRSQCPSVCVCLQGNRRLRCSNGGATDFPNFPADIRQAATSIEFRGNFITSIQASDLQGFVNLETLDLSLNRITAIEEGSFSSTAALSTLDLSFNQLRELPDNIFESTTLFTLDLRSNNIANVSGSTFTGVQPGATIQLGDNVLTTLPQDVFRGPGNLDELSLSGNPIICDCTLMWFPAFRSSVRILNMIGSCDMPASLSGASLETLTEDQFLCNCTPSCVNGTCNTTVGECECDDGYIGTSCDTPCPVGLFGAGCSQNCTCLSERESSPCEGVDGTCNCLPGYTGSSCEEECPDGFYGQDCLDVCQCVNGECHFITGFCNCSIGYMGVACDMICPPLRYGLGCSETCTCQTGNCHHITGNCSCPIGYFGLDCDHNCTDASDCGDIGREECSLDTPEQTCGPCLMGYVGEEGDGISECIQCSGAPNCSELNRAPCSEVVDTCGSCFRRHLTAPGHEGFSNEPCFDPCIDGIMNYNETDIDCGGPLCNPCSVNQSCTTANDCGDQSVCLGIYTHPSRLSFPFDILANHTCIGSEEPGNAIAEKFMDALRGRENPLPDIARKPDFTRDVLEGSVEREYQEQFNIPVPLESVDISELAQRPGDPLYQTSATFTEGTEESSVEEMIQNIHSGKLLGTVLFNQRDRKALHNI